MEKKKPKRTGMQIYCDCIKVGREVRAKAIKDEIYGGVEKRDIRRDAGAQRDRMGHK